VLKLKERLGLFDDPYRRGSGRPDRGDVEARRRLAREAARRSIVLLSCRNSVLPVREQAGSIAVVGPLATARGEMLGPWASAGQRTEATSILEGLKAALPGRRIEHALGVDIEGEDESGIAHAADLCARAETVVLSVGEAAGMSGEAASRTSLGLPGRQRALAEAALGVGKPVIALLSSGRPLALPWLFERADAVLATWFLGVESGHAIADVLTGKFNPSGRLPVSWLRSVGQAPLFYSQRATGRPTAVGVHYSSSYIDSPATPQFPFGHGLSYSRFVLSNLRCEPPRAKIGETIHVSVEVRNDSGVAGEATLFLFVRDPVASVARPLLELKGVRKILLGANESAEATWGLPPRALTFVAQNLEAVVEPGLFEVGVGQSSDPQVILITQIEVTD
jgi:beta-glucosidase